MTESTETHPIAGLSSAWTAYRYMALIVGVVLAILTGLFIGVHLLGHDKPSWYSLAWTAHGWIFPIYVVATYVLSGKLKWSLSKTVVIMAAGTVPFMSFIAERKVAAQVAPHLPK